MGFTKSYIFPILFGFWLPLTVFITYTVSVLTDHVTPILPYISDTGSWAPESCIFGMMLTIGALIMLSIMYIRYRQVGELQKSHQCSERLKTLNKYSLYTGILSVFGGLIVANFQVRLIFLVHIIGASICFGFGTLYQIMQVVLSIKLYPMIGKKTLNIFRIIFTTVSVLSLTVTSSCGLVAFIQFEGPDMTKWGKKDGGYEFHFASAVGEYVLTLSTLLNIVSFVEEFKYVEVHQPLITNKLEQQK